MTNGSSLQDTYGATLDRIKAQGGRKFKLGMTTLMWICHSERPMGVEELCQALGVEIGLADCNEDDVPSIWTVLSCCQGLVIVDKEGSTVRLIHYTLQEYLTTHPNFFQSPHSTIAETCLTYLNSQQVMALSGTPDWTAQHPPFLKYSSLYWGAHMKKEPSDGGKTLALKLFSHYQRHRSIRLLLEHIQDRGDWYGFSMGVDFYEFAGLHCASIFGLVEIVRTLTMMAGVDINLADETGARPLLWAAMSGHEVVVKLLLGCEDVDPDRPDKAGRTPLSRAAGNGHEAVVKLLLGREDVNPDKPSNSGQTPISWAAKNGHEAVVKLLLGQEGVNPDRRDTWGKTPIMLAAENRRWAVVELLKGGEGAAADMPDI